MKILKVEQVFNPEFDYTDKTDNFIYLPTKITNSTTPKLHTHLTEAQLIEYCDSEDWEVSIF